MTTTNLSQPAIPFEQSVVHPAADPVHGWTLTTSEVAEGFGVSDEAIRSAKTRHIGELQMGKHWLPLQIATGDGSRVATAWTKRGVVRLGFFITSERAKRFRDWAEDLVIGELVPTPAPPALPAAKTPRRRSLRNTTWNRDLMRTLCDLEDLDPMSLVIVAKLANSLVVPVVRMPDLTYDLGVLMWSDGEPTVIMIRDDLEPSVERTVVKEMRRRACERDMSTASAPQSAPVPKNPGRRFGVSRV